MPSRPRSLRALAFGYGKRKSSPEPPSPTFSDTTNASAMNFGPSGPEKIITRANLKASLQAYEDLMTTSAEYRAALMTMSRATAAFADALENCSGLKGPSYEASTRLQAASGLHHLMGNHWHVLAEVIEKKFEKPLHQHLETYRTIIRDRSASYERALREKSQVIRDTEKRSMNRQERNLQSFREALAVLQRQVDDLDNMKASHYREIIEHEQEVWEVVQGKACIVVRSSMDVFDRFTAKASDPILEPMLQSVPDPFDSYGPPQAEDQIFSILAPLSIMTSSSSPSPITGHSELDSTEAIASDKIASWLPNTSNGAMYSSESTEWATSPTSPSPISTPPRSVSPPIISRKHSSPPSAGQRKAESKLRSVLSVIDEARTSNDNTSPVSSGFSHRTMNGSSTPPDTGQEGQPPWSSAYGESPYYNDNNTTAEEEAATPRHSFFHTELPPDRNTGPPGEPDETPRAALAPAVS